MLQDLYLLIEVSCQYVLYYDSQIEGNHVGYFADVAHVDSVHDFLSRCRGFESHRQCCSLGWLDQICPNFKSSGCPLSECCRTEVLEEWHISINFP